MENQRREWGAAGGEASVVWRRPAGTDCSPQAREYHAMACLSDGEVVMYGGHDQDHLDDTWQFALSTGKWREVPCKNRPEKRRLHAMTEAGEGRVFLYGGHNDRHFFKESWLFEKRDMAWKRLPVSGSSPCKRVAFCLSRLGHVNILLFGGFDGSTYLNDTWLFNLEDGAWRQLPCPVSPPPRGFHAGSFLGDGMVLVHGGFDGKTGFGDTWLFDMDSMAWRPVQGGISPAARRYHGMASLGNGAVFLYGGYNGRNFNDSWLFDLKEGWRILPSLSNPRDSHGHGMCAAGPRRIILFGGNRSLVPGRNLCDTWLLEAEL